MLNRRNFLKSALSLAVCALSFPGTGFSEGSKFYFAQLSYGGDWDPRPRAHNRLLSSIELRTSVSTAYEKKVLSLTDADLFKYPFLYMAGSGAFEPFTDDERRNLRKYLKLGGTLIVDDVSGSKDSEFDAQIRKEFEYIIPEISLTRLPQEHVVYKSFYLLHSASGRKLVEPYLEGITFTDEDRTSVFYSRNDLGGAWSEDEFGKWEYECIPGGEAQRELAMRLGINMVMYSLTGNYKKDQIHVPFIKKRQML